MANLLKIIAGLLVFAFVLISFSLDNSGQFDAEFRQRIKDSEKALKQQNIEQLDERIGIEILASGKHLDDQKVNAMLRHYDHLDHPILYRSSFSNNQIYAISASGIDNRQHLVNAYLEGYAPFETENVMIPLYLLAQRKSYQLDHWNYFGKGDIWQSSRQAFYYSRGDCEDHAILLADWLITMGEDARVVLGYWGDVYHAWVILFKDGKEFLLEATKKSGLGRNKPYPLAQLYPNYRPEFMFDQGGFWVNTGSKFTTRYSGHQWQKRSNFWTYE